MSPNIQDGGNDTSNRKRSLSDYLDATKPATPSKLKIITDADSIAFTAEEEEHHHTSTTSSKAAPESPIDTMSLDSPLSEVSDSRGSLLGDDAGSSTPALSTSSEMTPQKLPASGSPHIVIDLSTPTAGPHATTKGLEAVVPPAKRKRLTMSEREEKAKAEAARKAEKEKVEALRKQERDEHKAAADAKKKAVAEEREKKRKQKEEEDRKRNEEKEKKRKEKEDEERKVQEAKNKKERSQLRLNSFFKTGGSASSGTPSPASTPSFLPGSPSSKLLSVRKHSVSPQKPRPSACLSSQAGAADASSDSTTTAATEISEYDRIFKPFFIKENVTIATELYGMDSETKEAKSCILDQFLSGARGEFLPTKPFSSASARDYFHLPSDRITVRGRRRPAVRKIMNMLGPDALYCGGLSSASNQDVQTKLALDLLKSVPMKFLFFREDVRPAYYGTVTSQPPQARLSRLARNPLIKTVLPLNYDYDSEAEWVDDGDGEDVDDLDDEEEELEDDGEMSDFLDDSEDAMPLRPAFSGGMEPESTGVCWEDERRQTSRPELDSLRMEMILDQSWPIDPFSTQYWETKEVVAAPNATCTPSGALAKSMAPPIAPADAFAALGAGALTAGTSSTTASADAASVASTVAPGTAPAIAGGKAADPKKTAGVAAEFLPDLKKSILQYAKLSKVGIIEIISVEFTGKCTKSQIKNSLEALAERTGTGQNKTWKLKT
ncbi:chromatin assembly factor-I (CAF-I) p90 subunit [Sporothrix epigloea]|uniref:Chromatin assembly factor-I (CAF-I) p90 subunit n=1 Tax=Sporothrix epigloea TaxID=1892477 RepID=A0ABP0DVB6_9PEZI